jgi:chemotaxis protein CheD
MTEQVLQINETDASRKPVRYVCFGLGSCIGLFIVDKLNGVSGGAHIPLPSELNGTFQGAPAMIGKLLSQLAEQGSDLAFLRAKLAGGARVFDGSLDVGSKNIDAVLQQLAERRIFVAAKDVGGRVSRTARFSSSTGELEISTSEQKKYTI